MRPAFLFLTPLLLLPLACTDTPAEPENSEPYFRGQGPSRPDPGNYIKAKLTCRSLLPGHAAFAIAAYPEEPPTSEFWRSVHCNDRLYEPIPSDAQFPFWVYWTVECPDGEDSGIREFESPNIFKVPYDPDAFCYNEVTLKLEYVTID